MKAVILQSGYIPWLGYFDLINQVDVFVFLDDVQWTTRDWRNRNRIRTPQGWIWLTVPAKLEGAYYDYAIKDVEIDNSQHWRKNHLGALSSFYKKSPYFDEVYALLNSILSKDLRLVIDLNYELIFGMCDYLGLKGTQFMFSQDMNVPSTVQKTDRLLYILDTIGAVTQYISGPAAKSYIEMTKFDTKGIEVVWHDYEHPYYNQNTWNSNVFIPYLSIVDLLFNHGQESLDILSHKKTVSKPEHIQDVMPDEYKKSLSK